MTLNDTIRALRRERGMTQEQLAEAMNVSAAAVSKWENGQSVPDILVLTALADFFEVSLDALVGYTVQAHRRGDMVARIRQLVVQKIPASPAEINQIVHSFRHQPLKSSGRNIGNSVIIR